MFEQSVIVPKQKPWTMAASLTLQCAVVAAVLLYSVLNIQSLGPISIPDPLPPIPRMQAVELVETTAARTTMAASSVVLPQRVFRAPARIAPASEALAAISDAPAIPTGIPGSGVGVPDGVPYGVVTAVQPIAPKPVVAKEKPPSTPTLQAVKVGGDVLEAQIIERVIPEYPQIARSMRVSGVVQLMGMIDRDGKVKSLQVLSGHPLLVKAAVDAVSRWRYRPTLLNKQPVEVMAPISVHFTLR